MRAASLAELNRIEIIDIPVPEIIEDTDVQVQVKAVGICGTDLHMFREHRADVQLPRIMGHELSGLVTKVGEGVTRVKVGDRVVLMGTDGSETISAETIAAAAHSFNYEQVCDISRRVTRVYYRGGKQIGSVNYLLDK